MIETSCASRTDGSVGVKRNEVLRHPQERPRRGPGLWRACGERPRCPTQPTPGSVGGACGGLALYLVGDVLFRARMAGSFEPAKLVGACGLLAVFGLGSALSALWLTAVLTGVLIALCGLEAREPTLAT